MQAFTVFLPKLKPRNTSKQCCKRTPRCATTPPKLSDIPSGDEDPKDDELPLELVEGYLDNAKVRPKIDIDADEYMLMWKLRKMLHEDDFKRIFDQSSRRIGEL